MSFMKKSFIRIATLIACLVVTIIFSACSKSIPDGKMPDGEVALTFDDSAVDNWFTYMPVLDSLNIKATFYVSNYHKLTQKQKDELHIMAAHGHEIAYHTTNHPDLVKALQKKGMAALITEEIEKDLPLMRKDGFNIVNFAFPFGSHNAQLDAAFLRTFKSIRAVTNSQNYHKSLVKQSGEKQLFYGASVDVSSKLNDGAIINLLNDAHTHNDCVVLLSHEINTPNYKYSVPLTRLRLIAAEAQRRNLKFVTVRQICS